jgi:hypothetical protein
MPGQRVRSLTSACLAVVVCGAGARCAEPRAAIRVYETRLSVENQTREPWTNVEVWVNDHYRVIAQRLEPGGRLDVPLSSFVAGFGQRFDRRRQTVVGVEVTASTASGQAITLRWGRGRRR